jgi:hypothetical protein
MIGVLAAGCRVPEAPGTQDPAWVDGLIAGFQSEPVGNPPRSIYRYVYHGETVYYVPAQCCDQFSALYDGDGNVLCAPDGGITGMGDGRCPDFLSARTNEVLVWSDSRQ